MTTLRFVTVRMGENTAIELVAATPKGELRVIELTEEQALGVIKDIAGHLRTGWRKLLGT